MNLVEQHKRVVNDWFVIESGQDGAKAVIVHGIQTAADELHRQMCDCGGLRWIDCETPGLKKDVETLFDSADWTDSNDGLPFRWQLNFEDGYVRVVRITDQVTARALLHGQNLKHLELSFSVPLIPPSVNHYKAPKARGGYYVTPEAKAFIDAVPVFARPAAPRTWPWFGTDSKTGHGKPARIFYEVELMFHIHRPRFLAGDSDNLEKVAFDALTTCGAITDDRYVKYHSNRALPVDSPGDQRTEYSIRIVGEP